MINLVLLCQDSGEPIVKADRERGGHMTSVTAVNESALSMTDTGPLVGARAAKPPEAQRFCPFSYKRGAKS